MNGKNSKAQHSPGLKRAGFTSSFGVLATTLGSAVGLGNIWKFPYLTGANGGAGFLLATLLVGLPVMIAEISLGREAKANPISTLQALVPKRQPWLIGAAGMLAAFFNPVFLFRSSGLGLRLCGQGDARFNPQ